MASNINDYVDSGIQWINSALSEASDKVKAEQARQQQGAQAVDTLAANTVDPTNANESSRLRGAGLVGVESGGSTSKSEAVFSGGEEVSLRDLAQREQGASIKNENPLADETPVYGVGGHALVTTGRGSGGKTAQVYNEKTWQGGEEGAGVKSEKEVREYLTQRKADYQEDKELKLAQRQIEAGIGAADIEIAQNEAAEAKAMREAGDRGCVGGAIEGAALGGMSNQKTTMCSVAGEIAGGFTPAGVLVDSRDLGLAVGEAKQDLNVWSAAGVLVGVVGFVPGVGDMTKAGFRGLKGAVKGSDELLGAALSKSDEVLAASKASEGAVSTGTKAANDANYGPKTGHKEGVFDVDGPVANDSGYKRFEEQRMVANGDPVNTHVGPEHPRPQLEAIDGGANAGPSGMSSANPSASLYESNPFAAHYIHTSANRTFRANSGILPAGTEISPSRNGDVYDWLKATDHSKATKKWDIGDAADELDGGMIDPKANGALKSLSSSPIGGFLVGRFTALEGKVPEVSLQSVGAMLANPNTPGYESMLNVLKRQGKVDPRADRLPEDMIVEAQAAFGLAFKDL